jgi:hypothetical protein
MLAVVESWTIEKHLERVLIEMPMRNYPMVELALQCGYELCGFRTPIFPTATGFVLSKEVGIRL